MEGDRRWDDLNGHADVTLVYPLLQSSLVVERLCSPTHVTYRTSNYLARRKGRR